MAAKTHNIRRGRRRSQARGRTLLASLAFATLLIFTTLAYLPASTTEASAPKQQRTHYQVLEIQPSASLKDIKKAYRKLAVQHHPDRNLGNEEEATVKFREISEAYEILSDEDSRRDYDRALKGGYAGSGENGFKFSHGSRNGDSRRKRHRDPFAQFNDVFKNDPFFAEASRNMDDLFNKHFAGSGGDGGNQNHNRRRRTNNNNNDDANQGGGAGSWMWNKVKDYMPEVNVNIQTSTSTGGQQRSTTSRSYNNRRSSTSSSSYSSSGSSSNSRRSTYTSRSTRTVIENGKRVTIQSLEKDGNKIEEKYVGEELIERKINGRMEDLGRIGSGSGSGNDRREF